MPAAEATNASTMNGNGTSKSQTVTMLHFNDCYNVEPRALEPAGGAARFKTALQSFAADDPLVLFSGDILGKCMLAC